MAGRGWKKGEAEGEAAGALVPGSQVVLALIISGCFSALIEPRCVLA